MKKLVLAVCALGVLGTLAGCAPTTIGGQFSEPAHGWQRNGTYILTPDEMKLDCEGLRTEQYKAAKAIAYVDSVRSQKFGQSLFVTGVAAMFGMVRLPDMGMEEQSAKAQLRQGAAAFNVRLEEKGCTVSDIDELIAKATKEFRDARLEAEAAAEEAEEPKTSRQNFNNSDDETNENDVDFDHELN